ncbi:MAG: Uma2 family endonuclease [Desulfococcaceae bacterium]|nr:Uma2 family endonuclease [Desulfococcaceae bacterium]
MNWQQVCEYPGLQNLPFKIELDERGKIIMSPAKAYHALYQAEISYLLRHITKEGKALSECPIRTRKGTKVADAAWVSPERLKIIRYESECSVAPEICVEILSESNTDEEMAEKKQLYFENGAKEVWFCTEQGLISFYSPEGRLDKSEMIPTFPIKIEL